MNILREEIFKNTLSLLKLFKERAKLSEQIAIIKKERGLQIRDFTRELKVIKSIATNDKYTLGVLNFLFEFSLDFQTLKKLEIPWEIKEINEKYYKVLEGDKKIIELITGLILGRFGKLVYIPKEIPINLEIGFIVKGSHLVVSENNKKFLKLNLSNKFVPDIANVIFNDTYATLIVPLDKLIDYEKRNIEVII
ncbi:MAG: chorismate mutase [Thermoplasmata archaeon]